MSIVWKRVFRTNATILSDPSLKLVEESTVDFDGFIFNPHHGFPFYAVITSGLQVLDMRSMKVVTVVNLARNENALCLRTSLDLNLPMCAYVSLNGILKVHSIPSGDILAQKDLKVPPRPTKWSIEDMTIVHGHLFVVVKDGETHWNFHVFDSSTFLLCCTFSFTTQRSSTSRMLIKICEKIDSNFILIILSQQVPSTATLSNANISNLTYLKFNIAKSTVLDLGSAVQTHLGLSSVFFREGNEFYGLLESQQAPARVISTSNICQISNVLLKRPNWVFPKGYVVHFVNTPCGYLAFVDEDPNLVIYHCLSNSKYAQIRKIHGQHVDTSRDTGRYEQDCQGVFMFPPPNHDTFCLLYLQHSNTELPRTIIRKFKLVRSHEPTSPPSFVASIASYLKRWYMGM